jgi:hypothetical protein
MAQGCGNCGAPRTSFRASCEFCGTLYTGETTTKSPIPGLPEEFEIAIRRRELINAIKIYRETFKCDLKTAKEAVDRILQQHGVL